MQVNVSNKKQNPKLDSYVRDRLDLVVGRFDDRISHVDVRLLDENNGKGGDDKICAIEIKLIPRGQLHVRAKNENIYSAIVKAVHRAETVVAKAVDRGHRGHATRHQHGGVRNIPYEYDESDAKEPQLEPAADEQPR